MGIKERVGNWWEDKKKERAEENAFKQSVKAEAKEKAREGYKQGYLEGARKKARREAYARASQPSLGQRMANNFMQNSTLTQPQRKSSGGGFISPFTEINPNTGTWATPKARRPRSKKKSTKSRTRTITIKV